MNHVHTKTTIGHKATQISGEFGKDYTLRLGICVERMAANKRDTGRPAGKNASRQLWPRGDVEAEPSQISRGALSTKARQICGGGTDVLTSP